MRLEEREEQVLKMFKESKGEPLKYYSNNLALENNLVDAIALTKKGLVDHRTREDNRAYFSISKRGLDYPSTIQD